MSAVSNSSLRSAFAFLLLAFAGSASAGALVEPAPEPTSEFACVEVQVDGVFTIACGELAEDGEISAETITIRECLRQGGTVGSPYGDGRLYCMGFLGAPRPI